MTGVGMRPRMRHRCTIEMQLPAGIDPYGEPIPGDWVPNDSGVPCHFWSDVQSAASGAEETIEPGRTVVVSSYRLVIPLRYDIDETNRVTTITDRRRRPIADGPFAVIGVIPRPGYQLVFLREVS